MNGDTNAADQFVVANPDPTIYSTILNVNGAKFQINATGAVANGDAFVIVNAGTIVGTPVITSVNAGQTWVFDGATSRLLGLLPGCWRWR